MFFIKKPVAEYTTQVYGNNPWIIEALDEYFDDVLCNLDPKGCFIYGGAVRDSLSQMKLVGDLDIIVESDIFSEMLDTFRFSSRWSLKDLSDGSKYNRPIPATDDRKTSSNSIVKIATLFNKDNVELQLITPLDFRKDITDTIPCSRTAWDIVRNVDIRCSGLIMTLVGDLYEAVPNAVNDCHNRVLNINPLVSKDNIGISNLHKRVKKLAERGWKSNIDLSKYKIKQEESKKLTFTDIF